MPRHTNKSDGFSLVLFGAVMSVVILLVLASIWYPGKVEIAVALSVSLFMLSLYGGLRLLTRG